MENSTNNPITPQQFAKTIKEKYPQYKDVDDIVLAKKMIEKYPEYKSKVSFDQPVKKKEASVSVSNLANGNSSSVGKGQGKNIPDVLNTDKVKRNFQNQAISNEVSRPKIGQEKKVETKSYSDNLLDKNTEKKNADKVRLTQGLNYKDKMKVLSKSPATKFGDLQKEEYVQKTEKQIDDERKPAFVDREYKYDNLSNLPQGKDYSIYFPNVEQFGINREDFNTYLKVNQDEAFKTLADSGTLNEYLSNTNNLSDAKKMGQQQIFKVVGGYLNDRSGFLNSKLKYAKTEEEKSKIISELNTLNDNLKNWTKTNLPEFDKAMQDKIQREADDYLSSKNNTTKRKGSTNADKFGGSFFRGVAGSAMDVVASVADYLNNNDLAEEVRMNKNYMNDTYTSSLNSSVYANGKKVNYKGSNYIVSNDGRIYDADEKLDVTNISDKIGLDTDDFKKLVTQSKEESSFFSGRNATIAGGGVLGNLVTQVYGGGILGKGLRGLSVGEKSTLIGSTLVNSSIVGASVYEDTLNQLRDAGVSDNEAKSLASEASISAMAVTAVTSNFSYNPKAIQGLVGGNNIKTLTKEFIELANTQGLEVAKKTLSHKILSVAGESVKEGLGEVVQENFENFFQSLKGSEINTRINKKVLQEDYGIEDVITNSVLAFSTASALASIGSAKDYSIDNFERYKILGDNYESFSTQLNTFVESGFTTTEQAELLKKNVENYKKYSTKIPSKVAEKDLPKVIDLLAKRDEIEVEKANVDKSFHQEYNDELKLIDEQINGIVNPVPTRSDQQSNQQTNETIESTSPQQVYENVIAERKKLREDKLALIDEREALEIQEQTDETQKRIAEIDAEITSIDTQISENKTKGKEAYAELQSSKQTETVSTKEKIVEQEQEVENPKSKPIQSTVVSLTIEDVNNGKANLNEEISDQELVLENIRKKYGEDSEQFKSQELIVNELLDYKNNTAFSNGEHSLRFDKENKPIVTTESGKIVNETTKRKVIKEAISEGAFDQSERVLDREGLNMESEGQVIDYVIQNSQNPTEIAETISQQKEIDDSNNTRSDVETKIAEKVRNKSVKKSSFIKFGDKNQIDKRIDASYLSKNGKGLDEIAMEVETELYGDYNANQPRVTEQDVVDFILNNPSSREYWAKHESSEMQSLKENFEKYSGIPATNENLALFTNRQAENQTEVETENLPINDADLSFDDFNQELEMVYNEDFYDDLPFQKGNQNFRKLSQKAFKQLIDKLKKAFGGKNKIITSEAEFKAKLKELGLSESEITFMRTKDGNIFGAIFPDGTIYIDQNNLNANTPIHEYGHLWTNLAKEQNPEVYNQVLEIVKQDKQAMEEVRNDSAYSHLTTENQIAEEVLARQIGNIGEQNYWAKKDAGLVSKIKNAINDLFEYIKGIFGKSTPNVHQWTTEQFQNATLQELAEGISNDLLKGKQLFNASAQTSTLVQLSSQNNNQGIAPGTTVNLTPANTNHQVPTKLPEKLHKKIVELMRDKMDHYKTTKQVIDVGLDYLKKQEWYKNLNQEEKNYLETNLIKHLKIGYEKTPTQKPRAEIEAEVLRELAKNKSESTILPKYKNSRDQRIAKDIIERERTKNKQKKDVVAEVEKVFKDAEDAQKAKINVSVYFKRMIANIRKNFVDNQGKATKLLVDGGLKVVRNYIHVERGATGKAKEFYDSRAKKIYKGLSSKDVSVLNEIIMLKRIIQIDQDRIANGLPLVTHMRNLNQEKAEIYLEHLENTLGSQQFNKLNERAEMYFDEHKEMLNLLEENGVISSELKDKLISLDYQRREYIDFMKDEDGNYLEQNSTESKNAKQAIQSLTDGYDGLLVTDSEYLFSRTAQVTMNAIARNNTMLSLQKEMTAQKNRVESLQSKNPKDLTRKEKAEIKYFEQLEKQVTFDKKEAGRGFVEVNYTDQGEKKSVFMKQDFADSFRATYVASKWDIVYDVLGVPSKILKMVATGNNPTFFIVNTPRDIFTVATLSNEYGDNLLLNLFNISVGSGKNAGKMLIDRGMNLFGKDYQHNAMQKYIEYGGSMEMLNTQGDIRRTKLFDLITQRLDRRTVNTLEQLVGIFKLQAIQDASEMGTRLAVFERGVKNRFKKAGVKNEAEFRALHSNKTDFEVNQLLKDIYTSAVVSARDTSDFAQKGEAYTAMETFIPYFNASVQAKRFLYDSMKNDPAGTSSKILQGAVLASGGSVALGMMLLAMNLKDDDEDKKLSSIELYLKFYKGVSDYDKDSYFNIPIGKNDKGEFDYFRIAKSQDLTPFFSLTEGAIIALMKNQVGDTSDTEISQHVWKTMSRNWSPLEIEIDKGNIFKNTMGSISTNMTKNPLLKGIITYKTGYDFFRDQPLSFKHGKIDPLLEGYEKGSKVEEFYKVLGDSQNDSPVRMKAFVESLVTTPSTNPYVGMLYGGADYIFAKEETKEKKMFNDYIKKSFSGRVFKETNEFNREKKIDEATENMILENNREKLKKDAKMGLIADEVIAGNMSKNDAFKEIENSFDNPKDIVKQKKKLNERLLNKNVSSFVFDVKWEFNPKNKAILLMHLYGKDFNNDAVLDDKQKATKRDLIRMKAVSNDARIEYNKLINSNK